MTPTPGVLWNLENMMPFFSVVTLSVTLIWWIDYGRASP